MPLYLGWCPVVVGIEGTGSMQWFLELLETVPRRAWQVK